MPFDDYHVTLEHHGGRCVVCGKYVSRSDEVARLNVGDSFIIICCPLCFEVYEQAPDRFLKLHRQRASLDGGSESPLAE